MKKIVLATERCKKFSTMAYDYRHSNNISIKSLFGIILIIIFLTGCAATKIPVEKIKIIKTSKITLNQADSSQLSQKGLSVTIKPIHAGNIEQFPQFRAMLEITGIQKQRVYGTFSKYEVVPYTYKTDTIPLFPLPAFEVSFTNNTKNVIRFANATLALEDSSGNFVEALDKQDISSYLDEVIRLNIKGLRNKYKAIISARPGDLRGLYAKQRKLKLIDQNFKILPGRTIKGYLVFNHGSYTNDEFDSFISSQSTLEVQLFEIPVKLDKAANVLETASFSFVFDIGVQEKKVSYTVYE